MLRTKLGLMGLCAVVIGVMAMSASSAQAALSWLVLNSTGTTATELKAALLGETDSSHLILLATISKLMVSVVCTNFELEGVNLETGGTLTSGGKVKFSGCKAYGGEFALPLSNVLAKTELPCTVSGGGGASGTVITNKGKGKLVLHTIKIDKEIVEGKEVEKALTEVLTELLPLKNAKEEFEPFALLEFKGSECSLPAEDPVTGVLFLKDCEGKATIHAVKHLVEEGPLTALKLGTATATLLGSGWIKLKEEHVGLAWAAMDA